MTTTTTTTTTPVEPVAPDAPVPHRGERQTGADVLDRVRTWLERFVCTMTDTDLDLLALWAVHTHLVMETQTTPRLVLDSPVPGSGKTTVLEHLERLCLDPIQMATVSSPSMLARLLDDRRRTMLIDEADRALDPKKEGVGDLIAVLNSGYKRGGTRPVNVPAGKGGGWVVKEMTTYAAVAMAGNSPQLPEDTRSRTIRVLLLPDLEGRVEESDWEVCDQPAKDLRDCIAAWAEGVRDDVRIRPDLPEGIKGRSRERWGPLKRVALAAGGRWPAVVDQLALNDKEQQDMDREDGMVLDRPGVVLLRHLHEVWKPDERFVPTADLVGRLVAAYPSQWGFNSSYGKELSLQRFGRMLATSYGINSGREDRTGPRGYFRVRLDQVWRRMGVTTAASVPDPSRGGTGASGATGSTGAPYEIDLAAW